MQKFLILTALLVLTACTEIPNAGSEKQINVYGYAYRPRETIWGGKSPINEYIDQHRMKNGQQTGPKVND